MNHGLASCEHRSDAFIGAGAGFETPAPHDLLWISGRDDPISTTELPRWASDDWLAVAPVVVRREDTGDASVIPVGLRGRTRAERHAAYLPASRVLRRVTPESLAENRVWMRFGEWSRIPCIAALAELASKLDKRGLSWGITGSVGFALASGIPILRDDSDLDLLIRSPEPISRGDAAELCASLRTFAARIDVQVDIGSGGFALAEWAAGRARVLLKSGRGLRLAADPWADGSRDSSQSCTLPAA